MAVLPDNNGVGALHATFAIDYDGVAYPLLEYDVGAPVWLSPDGYIRRGDEDGTCERLLGRFESASGSVATVQICGVARFNIVGGFSDEPKCGDKVLVKRDHVIRSKKKRASGFVIAVDMKNNTCDVLL